MTDDTRIIQYEQDDDTDDDIGRATLNGGYNFLENVIEERPTFRSTKKKN